MYSAKIEGEPTTFGTSGLLFRSNKVMYDRLTKSLWHQFTGEPIVGPLADSGIKLPFFPLLLATWEEWVDLHPDTTVLSIETGLYASSTYAVESDPRAVYNDYFSVAHTWFPVPDRSAVLATKAVVLGVGIGEAYKAYPVDILQRERVVNDVLGGEEIVVVGSSVSQGARAYERDGQSFSLGPDDTSEGIPGELVDSSGVTWNVLEEHLVNARDSSEKLARVPTHMSFWFGWYSFHQDTELYTTDAP